VKLIDKLSRYFDNGPSRIFAIPDTQIARSGDDDHMSKITLAERFIDGVRIESAYAANPDADNLILIHGGCHGSWAFEKIMPFMAEAGWNAHAINWYGHNGSVSLESSLAIKRSIAEVATEIRKAASLFDKPPILVAHSMGGLAAQKYAENNPVRALVLLAPVVPLEAGASEVPLPLDESVMWGPPPFEIARELFFQGLSEQEAQKYYGRLCAESPRSVFEATRFTISIEPSRITCPVLAFEATDDRLVPPPAVERMAKLYGADYRLLEGRGHSLTLEPRWPETCVVIRDWLAAKFR
jgi:pimeloyl-ACP methyl ester carboxylesterase